VSALGLQKQWRCPNGSGRMLRLRMHPTITGGKPAPVLSQLAGTRQHNSAAVNQGGKHRVKACVNPLPPPSRPLTPATNQPTTPHHRQGEELEPARAKAEAMGVKSIFIDDLRETFVKDYVFPMFRANSVYEVRVRWGLEGVGALGGWGAGGGGASRILKRRRGGARRRRSDTGPPCLET